VSGKDHNKDTARAHCWTATEARLVVEAAKEAGTLTIHRR
jgi:hypothetical protein